MRLIDGTKVLNGRRIQRIVGIVLFAWLIACGASSSLAEEPSRSSSDSPTRSERKPAAVSQPLSATPPSALPPGTTRSTTNGLVKQRLREGTEWNDRNGTFELTGDRARFKTADDATIVQGLENLALERVVHALRDDPIPNQPWKVSGVILEFEGRNYILLTKAIQLTKTGGLPKTDRPSIRNSDPDAERAAPSDRGADAPRER